MLGKVLRSDIGSLLTPMRIMNWYTFGMENLEQEELEVADTRPSPLHTVTPLSKYLAMALFVTLPFIGGWIGYTYTPEKIIYIEKITYQEIPTTTKSKDSTWALPDQEILEQQQKQREAQIKDDKRRQELYFNDSPFIQDMPDEELFNKFGYEYIITKHFNSFKSGSPLRVSYSEIPLYKYDQNTSTYKLVHDNILELNNAPEVGDLSLYILTQSNSKNILYFSTNFYEGGRTDPLLTLDPNNLNLGFSHTNVVFSSHTDEAISPDQNWLVGLKADNPLELVVFDLERNTYNSALTLNTPETFLPTDEYYCFGECVMNAKWINNTEFSIKILSGTSSYSQTIDVRSL